MIINKLINRMPRQRLVHVSSEPGQNKKEHACSLTLQNAWRWWDSVCGIGSEQALSRLDKFTMLQNFWVELSYFCGQKNMGRKCRVKEIHSGNISSPINAMTYNNRVTAYIYQNSENAVKISTFCVTGLLASFTNRH